jgi:hypothetical protein
MRICSGFPGELVCVHDQLSAHTHLLVKLQFCSIIRHFWTISANGMSCQFCGKQFNRGYKLRRCEQERNMSQTDPDSEDIQRHNHPSWMVMAYHTLYHALSRYSTACDTILSYHAILYDTLYDTLPYHIMSYDILHVCTCSKTIFTSSVKTLTTELNYFYIV